MTAECTNNKVFNTNDIETLPVEEAWQNVIKTAKQAVEDRDLDDFRDVSTPSLRYVFHHYLIKVVPNRDTGDEGLSKGLPRCHL